MRDYCLFDVFYLPLSTKDYSIYFVYRYDSLTKLKSYIDKNRQKETEASSYFIRISDFISVQDNPEAILININLKTGNLVDRLNNYVTILL